MLQNQILFHKNQETSFSGYHPNSPIIIKCNNQFKLNCRNAIKQSKLNLPQLPKIQMSNNSKPLQQRCVNTDRSPKIKLIKEIQREIGIFENRQKVRSLFRNFSRLGDRNEEKENFSKIKSFSKLKVHLEPLEQEKQEASPQVSSSLKIRRKPSQYLPKCKVGKVRYRAPEKTNRNFWEEIKVSQIEIKNENEEEEIGTLLNIEAEMNRNE